MATKGKQMTTTHEIDRTVNAGNTWIFYEHRGIQIKFFHNGRIDKTTWTIVKLGGQVRIRVASLADAIAKIDEHLAA
jgi:hypothetical protein